MLLFPGVVVCRLLLLCVISVCGLFIVDSCVLLLLLADVVCSLCFCCFMSIWCCAFLFVISCWLLFGAVWCCLMLFVVGCCVLLFVCAFVVCRCVLFVAGVESSLFVVVCCCL